MGRKAYKGKVVEEYAGYLREIMPLIASTTRFPKRIQYEYQVAKMVEKKRNRELIEQYGKEKTDGFYKYTARDVHTQVGRALQLLVAAGEVRKIGKCYYPVTQEGLFLYEIFLKNVRLASSTVHVISGTAIAISIIPGQEAREIKSALRSCLGEENLFGALVQDDLVLILLSPETPQALFAEFSSWVSDAYRAQHTANESC